MASEAISYDKAEIRAIQRAFKAMDDEAVAQAKEVSNRLATWVRDKIVAAANQRDAVAARIGSGSRVVKSSKTGEISFGFASQKLSGGGTTQMLWGGSEFGSNRYKQFPKWSGAYGRGSRGWWIYPTLRQEQPVIVKQWEDGFSEIVKRFD